MQLSQGMWSSWREGKIAQRHWSVTSRKSTPRYLRGGKKAPRRLLSNIAVDARRFVDSHAVRNSPTLVFAMRTKQREAVSRGTVIRPPCSSQQTASLLPCHGPRNQVRYKPNVHLSPLRNPPAQPSPKYHMTSIRGHDHRIACHGHLPTHLYTTYQPRLSSCATTPFIPPPAPLNKPPSNHLPKHTSKTSSKNSHPRNTRLGLKKLPGRSKRKEGAREEANGC